MKWYVSVCFAWLLIASPASWATEPAATAPEAAVAARVDQLEGDVAQLRRELAELRQLLEKVAREVTPPAAALLEERVSSLEETGRQLGAQTEELGNTVRDQNDSLATLSLTEERRIQVNTYGTFNVIDASKNDSVYDAEAFELVLSGKPSERISFFAEIEFERAATVGGRRGGEVLVEQAYANFALTRRLHLRAGVLLVPFGNVNVDHYAPNRDVISKPLVSYVVAPSDWTDNGFGLQGSVLIGGADSLAFEIYTLAGLDANISALGTRAARQPFGEDNNNNKAVAMRVAWDQGGNFQLGLSAYTGKVDDEGRERLEGWAADAHWQKGPLLLTGEFDRFEGDSAAWGPLLLEGWYARATWKLPALLAGRHSRLFPAAHLDLVAQYDHAHIEGPFADAWEVNREWRRTLGINYHPSHQWVLKLNHERSEADHRPLQFGSQRAWLGSIGFQF